MALKLLVRGHQEEGDGHVAQKSAANITLSTGMFFGCEKVYFILKPDKLMILDHLSIFVEDSEPLKVLQLCMSE